MDRSAAEQFAHEWIAAWNASDLDAVLRPHHDDTVFVSPRARTLLGHARVEGKEALRTYWKTAMEARPDRLFTLDHALWDEKRRELLVLYVSRVDGRSVRACELIRLDEIDRQVYGEALYGAEVEAASDAFSSSAARGGRTSAADEQGGEG